MKQLNSMLGKSHVSYRILVLGATLDAAIDAEKDISDARKTAIKKELTRTIDKIAKEMNLSVQEIQKALSQPGVLNMLKAFGFSLKAIYNAVHEATSLIPKGLESTFKEIHKTKAIQNLNKGATKVDEFLDKHPIIKKLTGPAVAGLLFMGWNSMSFVGNADYDFDLSLVTQALTGDFKVADLFTSPSGLAWMGLVTTGIATGGMLSVPWFKSANFAVAMTYTGLKQASKQPWAAKAISRCQSFIDKMYSKLNTKVLKSTKSKDKKDNPFTNPSFKSNKDNSGDGNNKWWKSLTKDQQKQYLKDHPNSKFAET